MGTPRVALFEARGDVRPSSLDPHGWVTLFTWLCKLCYRYHAPYDVLSGPEHESRPPKRQTNRWDKLVVTTSIEDTTRLGQYSPGRPSMGKRCRGPLGRDRHSNIKDSGLICMELEKTKKSCNRIAKENVPDSSYSCDIAACRSWCRRRIAGPSPFWPELGCNCDTHPVAKDMGNVRHETRHSRMTGQT